MTQNTETICPACREQMRPTQYREVRANNGQVIRRIPLAWDCSSHCQTTLRPDEWNAAVSRFEAEQRGEG